MEEVLYTVNGTTNALNKDNGIYARTLIAPEEPGTYEGSVKVTRDGISTVIDSTDARFKFSLRVNEEVPVVVDLKKYLPGFMLEVNEFKELLKTQSRELDYIRYEMDKGINNLFIDDATEDAIERIEKFLGVHPIGTLKQRKDYLKGLYVNGAKINKTRIQEIVKNITGGDVLVKFYGSDEADNPYKGNGYLEIKVLSPSLNKDYNFENVERTIKPLIAAHLKLSVMKWFATWGDISSAYIDWEAIKTNADSWDSIYLYTPPQ